VKELKKWLNGMLITSHFDRGDYGDLLTVMKRSAVMEMGIDPIVIPVVAPDVKEINADCSASFLALAQYVIDAGVPAICSDADMMFTGDMSDVWQYDFDVAYTVRDTKDYVNSGMWFYRPTDAGRRFVKLWMECVRKPSKSHRRTYGPGDQGALVHAIEMNTEAKLLALPCRVWNSTQYEWESFGPDTKAVHIKSELRDLVRGKDVRKPIYEHHHKLAEMWRAYL
jgi:hypothetical protein